MFLYSDVCIVEFSESVNNSAAVCINKVVNERGGTSYLISVIQPQKLQTYSTAESMIKRAHKYMNK